MNYWRLALAVSASAFAVSSIVLSAVFSMGYPLIARRLERLGPVTRAAALWRLRLAPSTAALLFAFGFVLPTFLAFEPRDTSEPLSITLAVLGSAGAAMLAIAALRGARAWAATRALERRWAAASRGWDGDAPLPVRVISDPFPTVAVIGLVAPRLYVADRVLAECPAPELRAMIAHESAHVAARDNLKRFAMRVCPDVLWVRAPVERAWASAAEESADAVAAAGSPERRLDLAQALVRVARLAPAAARTMPASAFYLGGSIESRVRRLLDGATEPAPGTAFARAIAAVAIAVAATLVISAPALHQTIEALVRHLP